MHSRPPIKKKQDKKARIIRASGMKRSSQPWIYWFNKFQYESTAKFAIIQLPLDFFGCSSFSAWQIIYSPYHHAHIIRFQLPLEVKFSDDISVGEYILESD